MLWCSYVVWFSVISLTFLLSIYSWHESMVLSNCEINLIHIETSSHLLVKVNRLFSFEEVYKVFYQIYITHTWRTATQIRAAHARSHPECWCHKEWPRPYCNQEIPLSGEGNILTLVQIDTYHILICVEGTINANAMYKVTRFLKQKIFGQNTLIFARSVCYQWSLAQWIWKHLDVSNSFYVCIYI